MMNCDVTYNQFASNQLYEQPSLLYFFRISKPNVACGNLMCQSFGQILITALHITVWFPSIAVYCNDRCEYGFRR